MDRQAIRDWIRTHAKWPAYVWALLSGATTGRIGYRTWYLSRHVHCATNGLTTDILTSATNLRRPKVAVQNDIAERVRRHGGAMFPFRMSP